MLRLIHIGNTLPMSYPVDPTATFEPGMIGELKVIGNEIVCGVSDGTAPIGILDDVKASAFTSPVKDEVVTVSVVAISDGYDLIAAVDTKQELQFANIVRSSFVSDVAGLVLNDINGMITVPAGTPLNHDADGDGTLDAVQAIVSYVYRIPNLPGDDSTVGSGRCTIWYQRGIFETDKYDTTQAYVVNATLFVNADGVLTSAQPSSSHPGIAMVTAPPTALLNTLEFIWL